MPQTFKDLVVELAQKHHGGAYYPMAKRLQVSTALVYQWKDGITKRPQDEYLERLCDAYGLRFDEVKEIVRGRPLPSSRPAPTPRRGRNVKRVLGFLLAATLGGVPAQAGTPPRVVSTLTYCLLSEILHLLTRARHRCTLPLACAA